MQWTHHAVSGQVTPLSQVDLWFTWGDSIENLNIPNDNNEALELETVFYNYLDGAEEERGNSFIPVDGDVIYWESTLPNPYLDTNIFDGDEEISACVGEEHTADLIKGKEYMWSIETEGWGKQENYPNDERYKITAQRSYTWFLTGAFGVFAEEHEPIIRLGDRS